MKLRNKKTGEIIEFDAILPVKDVSGDSVAHLEYNSLTELNEEWEDYEEPKGYWYIRDDGSGVGFSPLNDSTVAHRRSIIGDYFESEEEAKRASEKLEAITRLKSCGFKFKGWRTADLGADKYYFVITAESDGAGKGDLDLLFSGGEK